MLARHSQGQWDAQASRGSVSRGRAARVRRRITLLLLLGSLDRAAAARSNEPTFVERRAKLYERPHFESEFRVTGHSKIALRSIILPPLGHLESQDEP